MDLTLIITVGVLLGCVIGLSWFAGSDAPYVPSKKEKIKKALKLVNLTNKTFYELGSGDGRVILEASRKGAIAFGIEQSWIRVLYSRWKAQQLKINAHFIHGDIFKQDLSSADVVFIYLLHLGVDKLEKKLKKELKKGSIIITQTYHFKNWKPFKKLDLSKDLDSSKDIQGAGNFWLYRV